MTAVRRFRLTFEDGSEFFCLAFPSDTAREQALTGQVPEIPAAAGPQIEPERPRGRPSFDLVIAGAVRALGAALDPTTSLSARARIVQRHLAQTCDAADIPNARTVERHLAGEPARQNSRQKWRQKSPRVKITSIGG